MGNKDIRKKIESHEKAYREHVDKANKYKGTSKDHALKTAERIRKEIDKLKRK